MPECGQFGSDATGGCDEREAMVGPVCESAAGRVAASPGGPRRLGSDGFWHYNPARAVVGERAGVGGRDATTRDRLVEPSAGALWRVVVRLSGEPVHSDASITLTSSEGRASQLRVSRSVSQCRVGSIGWFVGRPSSSGDDDSSDGGPSCDGAAGCSWRHASTFVLVAHVARPGIAADPGFA